MSSWPAEAYLRSKSRMTSSTCKAGEAMAHTSNPYDTYVGKWVLQVELIHRDPVHVFAAV